MNADEIFFDTNILLYLFSKDEAKAERAEALVADGGLISVYDAMITASALLSGCHTLIPKTFRTASGLKIFLRSATRLFSPSGLQHGLSKSNQGSC